MTINNLITDLESTALIPRLLSRNHLPTDVVQDLAQSLYLYWLENPVGIMKANDNDYLLQYVTKACRNTALSYRNHPTMVSIENLDYELY